RPLTIEEIKVTVELFAQAANNTSNKAGFDGVEIHGANGHLVDQFIQDMSNNRTDQYGVSMENRSRYALEIVDAVATAIGEERTAIRLSPWATGQGNNSYGMKNPYQSHRICIYASTYPKLAYLHMIQTRELDNPIQSNEVLYDIWSPQPLIVADGFTREKAFKVVEREGVLVAFGRQFISNPDLPLRLKNNLPLSAYDRATFYGGDESGKGYTDYAFALQ
ncbi:FMN-linked oxidoreductase, partial [Gymnopus androsaceus JB14]